MRAATTPDLGFGPRSRTSRRILVLPCAFALLALGACDIFSSDDDDEPSIAAVVQQVSASGGTVSLENGTPPQDSGAPVAAVAGNQTIISGGGTGFNVSASSSFTEAFVWIDGEDGYYRVSFSSPRDLAELILVYANVLSETQYNFQFAVGTGGGAGTPNSRQMTVISVGTGDVQVSVSWDVPSDVDLYVVDPLGEEIFYGNRTSSSGGELDLDSNEACGGQDLRNENITWDDDAAPRGQYQVRVNYWSACSQERTNWVVTVRVRGQPTRTFSGTFTGSGSGGASGAGEVVTTFTY